MGSTKKHFSKISFTQNRNFIAATVRENYLIRNIQSKIVAYNFGKFWVILLADLRIIITGCV